MDIEKDIICDLVVDIYEHKLLVLNLDGGRTIKCYSITPVHPGGGVIPITSALAGGASGCLVGCLWLRTPVRDGS